MIKRFRYALMQLELRMAANFLSGALKQVRAEALDKEDYPTLVRAFNVENALEILKADLQPPEA